MLFMLLLIGTGLGVQEPGFHDYLNQSEQVISADDLRVPGGQQSPSMDLWG